MVNTETKFSWVERGLSNRTKYSISPLPEFEDRTEPTVSTHEDAQWLARKTQHNTRINFRIAAMEEHMPAPSGE